MMRSLPDHRLPTGRIAPKSFAATHGAFTLVELLVTVAVLAILILLTAQLVNSATDVVATSNKRLDADSGSRLAFGRMGADLEGMILRPDADCFFVKNTGNDAFYFYSQTVAHFTGGEGPHAPLAFVGYRVANRANPVAAAPNHALERIGVGLGYDNALAGKVARFLTYPAPTIATPTPLPVKESTIAWTQGADGKPDGGNRIGTAPSWDNPDFQPENQVLLSAEIFRLEFCFLMDDGTYCVLPKPGSEPWNNAAFINAMGRVRREAVALVVTVALLDEKSQAIVSSNSTDSPDFSKAIAAFADGDTPNVATTWKSTLEANIAASGTMNTLGMPLAAASQIRIYQRAFAFKR